MTVVETEPVGATEPGATSPLLECRGVCKRFGAVEALVDVEVFPGEVGALVGDNDVVFEVADRIVVLRVGRRVATFEQRETTPQEVVGAIVGLDEI